MRVFKVPFDIKREEKIFGGYLSLRQVTYLMLAASSLAIFATTIPVTIKILFITFFCTLFLLCTFLKLVSRTSTSSFFMQLNIYFAKRTLYM